MTTDPPDAERTGPRMGRLDNTTTAIVSDIERARRRWRLHKRFTVARRISAALDAKCGIERPEVTIDYHGCGLDLGMPERRAAGLALLEQERAA